MKLLLDTHVWLWFLMAPARLRRVVEVIEDPANDVYVSSVSAAEIAIKKSLGKLSIPDDFLEPLAVLRFQEVTFAHRHAVALASLPWHHKDPFDRMLVAQAQADGLILVSHDANVLRYPIPTLAVA